MESDFGKVLSHVHHTTLQALTIGENDMSKYKDASGAIEKKSTSSRKQLSPCRVTLHGFVAK